MSKLFIWLPQGRLGNLIFQYQAIAHIAAGGRVLAPASEFFDLFESSRRFWIFPAPQGLRRRLHSAWTALFGWLARRGWIGTIEPGSQVVREHFTWETSQLQWKRGYFPDIFAVKGYFQTPQYLEPLPQMKHELLHAAESRLATVAKRERVAVHMRLGDYRHWPVFGVPGDASLPVSYYVKALSLIRSRVPDAQWLVLSDEPDEAQAVLARAGLTERIVVVQRGTAQGDFALIASCSHAILSASTFSWWAAILIANPDRLLVAPKYWVGFRTKTWFPPGIQSDHFLYIDPLG